MLKYDKWNEKWQSLSGGGKCPGCDRELTWVLFKDYTCMYVYDDGTEIPKTISHSLYGTCCNEMCFKKAKDLMTEKQISSSRLPMHEIAQWDWHRQWAKMLDIPWEEETAVRKAASKEKALWLTAAVGRYFRGPKHLVRVLATDPDSGSVTFMVIDRMPHCLGRGVTCPGSQNHRTFSIESIQTLSYFSYMPLEDEHINDLLYCLEVNESEFKNSLEEVFSQIRSEMFGEFHDVSTRPCLVRDL